MNGMSEIPPRSNQFEIGCVRRHGFRRIPTGDLEYAESPKTASRKFGKPFQAKLERTAEN
jgi:hypothetical protein